MEFEGAKEEIVSYTETHPDMAFNKVEGGLRDKGIACKYMRLMQQGATTEELQKVVDQYGWKAVKDMKITDPGVPLAKSHK